MIRQASQGGKEPPPALGPDKDTATLAVAVITPQFLVETAVASTSQLPPTQGTAGNAR